MLLPSASRSVFAAAVLALAVPSAGLAQGPRGTATPAQLEANKQVVVNLWREVFDAQDINNAPKWISRDYIQHNPVAAPGYDGFVNGFGRMWAGKAKPVQPALAQEPAILMAEGDLVTIVFRRPRPEPSDPSKTYDAFWWDTFRVKDGKVVEHWDGATKPTTPGAPRP